MDERKLRKLAREAQAAIEEKDETEALLVLEEMLDEILSE